MTPDTQYLTHLVTRENGEQSLTFIFIDGSAPVTANDDHPHFDDLLDAVGNPDALTADEVRELHDLSIAVGQKFASLSERVTVANGRVYFDGDEVDNALSQHILSALNQGIEDYSPLVRFYENLAANPVPHSREQLYAWLRDREFTVTEDGCFLAYKGVQRQQDGSLVSISHGPAVVDGESVNGAVPNYIGAVVSIPRSKVQHDPAVGCASGLHAGTFEYASSWARGALLLVKINPRDVVSVPTDCSAQKIRVARYRVVDTIDHPESRAVVYDDYEDEEWYDDYEDGCFL